VSVDVIVLNGGSSAGKSSLAAELKERLDGRWLSLGIDDLIKALSYGPLDTSAGGTMTFLPGGAIEVEAEFQPTQVGWYAGLAAIARAGIGVIVDEVFLNGGNSQDELRKALVGLEVAWVGVRCDADVAEARERERGDRWLGLARDQAIRVHAGTAYDVVVDTTGRSVGECAQAVVEFLSRTPGSNPTPTSTTAVGQLGAVQKEGR
jgi:chloramphenicol 3-O phosphotransferase